MDVARDVIDLFSTKDAGVAREIANRLDKLNTDRQEEQRRILLEIDQRLADDSALRESFCMVIDGEGWHRGVIGITATRVVERYGRPALVVSRDGDEAHGSGRSIPAFHLLNALESCAPLFTRFGGHAHAVGFSLPSDRVSALHAHLDAYARARLSLPDFEQVVNVDAELPLDSLTPDFCDVVRKLEPFGAGNPQPVFFSKAVRLIASPRILKEKHVRMKLSPGQNGSAAAGWRRAVTHNAVGWRMAERMEQARLLPGDLLDIAFTLEENEHPEFGGIELSLRDFQRVTIEDQAARSSAAPN
jgi:single-stranded-DNA-specific exonuclease